MERESEGKINLVNILGAGRGVCYSGKYDFHSGVWSFARRL
jgi:hypothetical protein